MNLKTYFKSKKGYDMKPHMFIAMGVLIFLYYLNLKYKWLGVPTDNLSLIILVIVGIIYSVMADIDQPGSIINKWFTLVMIALILAALLNSSYQQYGIIAAVILGLLRLFPHRTFIHSVVGGALLALPLLYLGKIYFIVAMIAFLTHIISEGEMSFAFEADWN